jgi:GNAT superfamily N-acetyltransferase
MTTIVQASMPNDQTVVHDLFAEYLRWVCARIYQEYGAVFDAESILVHDMEKMEIFLPPGGILLLSYDDGDPAGCTCIRTIEENTAELKRMYVRPNHRRKGIGAGLVEESIRLARMLNYARIRLDSAGFMTDAHRVYRSLGFKDISAYDGSEIPVEYRAHWVFMQLDLA